MQPSLRRITSFATTLKFCFATLTIFTLIQAGLTLWVANESDYHVEKSRISNRILAEFIDLGGNKQRLKVWLAQFLLTDDSSIEVKNNLIFKMNSSLNQLEVLLNTDEIFNKKNAAEIIIVKEQKARFQTLKINIKQLENEVNKINKNRNLDPGEAWKFMIKVFDSLDGNDLRKVIGDAIEIQKLRAAEAETASKAYLNYFNKSVYFLTLLTVIISVMLSLFMQNAIKQPLNALVQAATEFSKGNMNYRIQELPENEFGIVSQKINEMALEIEKTRSNEIQKRSQIEQEVQIRTNELKLAIENLQKSESERKIFLANVSHELKTPATAILGEAAVTLRGSDKDTETYKETIKSIYAIGKQLSHRIDDLLLLARTDSNFFVLNLKSESANHLNDYLAEAVKIVDPDLQLRLNVKEKLRPATILIDKDRIIQLFVILLENAKKYSSEDAAIDIQISESNSKIQIDIQNTCTHLNDVDFDLVFNRYYRSNSAKRFRPDGLGIGLNLAQTIVKSHSGNITAESIEDKYFRISFLIPTDEVKNENFNS